MSLTVGKTATGDPKFRNFAGIMNDGKIFCKEIQIIQNDETKFRFENDGDIVSNNISCNIITATSINTSAITLIGDITSKKIIATTDVISPDMNCSNAYGSETVRSKYFLASVDVISPTMNCSNLNCANQINSKTFNATSDRRLKTNIVDLDPEYSNLVIRALRPTKYDFIRGKKGCIGFIAQDIEKLGLPVSKTTGFVAIMNCDVICNEGWFRSEENLVVGDHISFDYGEIETVSEIIEEKEGMYRMKEDLTGVIHIFGREVNDVRSIEKDAIFTVALAAMKRIDERVTNQEKKLDFLIKILGCALFYSLGASLYVLILSK
jgi:aspartate carbamoyltransferase regulatory subunit